MELIYKYQYCQAGTVPWYLERVGHAVLNNLLQSASSQSSIRILDVRGRHRPAQAVLDLCSAKASMNILLFYSRPYRAGKYGKKRKERKKKKKRAM